MSAHDALVVRLADLAGVAAGYRNAAGTLVDTGLDARRAVLAGLGLPNETLADTQASVERLERRRDRLAAPLIVAKAGQSLTLRLGPGARAGRTVFNLTDEAGIVREGTALASVDASGGMQIEIPALPGGYWRLRSSQGHRHAESLIISAPERCYEPAPLTQGRRSWGVTAQVYSLRSDENFGIGDYGDIAVLAARAASLGADFLGLSPVHALFASDFTKMSPYSPSSRLFLDVQFINPSLVAGFADSAARRLLETPDVQEALVGLRDAPLVDRQASWKLKLPLLDALWREVGRDDIGFAAFRAAGGHDLQAHALFEALAEHFKAQGAHWVGDWPEAYREASSEGVRRFAAEHEDKTAFHAWLQYEADRQLAAAQDKARGAGMDIGLFCDLAVGVDRAGSELWAAPERFASKLSIGAPPDQLGPEGQNWGLPPFSPIAMEEDGLAAFRRMAAAAMRHAGAIRIDHAFQLARLFLIPEGAPTSEGAYVAMPFEALLAVLRVESHRARCMVIAEDLGTGPEGFSDAIMAGGLYSYRVLPFEREADSAFKPPAAYPRRALAVLTTHDLPTFRGRWRGLDIDMRQTAGRMSPAQAASEQEERVRDRDRLTAALTAERLLPPDPAPAEPPVEAACVYLGRSTAALAAIQLEDAAGELNQPNLPGLGTDHPNWQRKLSLDLAELTAPGRSLARLGALLANEGRGGEAHDATALAAPPPRATYRLQFHAGFTFDDAVAILPYLARLGISHVYASPIQTARPGSTHGYDIVDHTRINPELGGEEGFLRLSEALKDHGLGLILDIVPNHMGIGGADNAWWLSVVEWGQLSPHAVSFDVDWERLGANGKLVLPFLGKRYGDALEEGELKLARDDSGGFSIWHFEHRFPISPLSYPILLDRILILVADQAGPEYHELLAISSRLRALSEMPAGAGRDGVVEACEALKRRLARVFAASPGVAEAVERAIGLVNGARGIPESFDTLHRILEMQSFRLANWRVAASDINYRRFFDINTLVGMRVEEPAVFERTHALILDLVREDRIHGLRIDHVDGLADPEAYVRQLQSQVGPGFYILVEKILGHGERLRPWPISGTTGYEVLNLIDGMLVDREGAAAIEADYRDITGQHDSFEELLRRAKRKTLHASFASELEVLVSDLARLAHGDRRSRDYTIHAMRQVLTEIIERLPVYRSYIATDASPADRTLIEETVAVAIAGTSMPDTSLHRFVAQLLLGDGGELMTAVPPAEHLARFRRRFQQLSGPVTAKSLEDTLFYSFGPLLALNEVGGEPSQHGVSQENFHDANAARRRSWPHAMIATATHDTKRGEDGRARLLALTEMPQRWGEESRRWLAMSRELAPGDELPDATDRQMILQQVLASWPFALLEANDASALDAYRERMQNWVEKALREAKRRTSWTSPNEAYEQAAKDLIGAALSQDSAFLDDYRPLAREMARRGMVRGLSRTVLKLTLPGVPDFYQGTEFWDLALVDPDNRRPVDYGARSQAVEESADAGVLLATWPDGRIKQRVMSVLLADRARAPRLYAAGDYQPVALEGGRAADLTAFSRTHRADTLLVLATRIAGGEQAAEGLPVGQHWAGTSVAVSGKWEDVLTDRLLDVGEAGLAVDEALAVLPVAVLRKR